MTTPCSAGESDITVIIRTALDPRRGALIERCIGSIVQQEGVHARPYLLANGNRCDPALMQSFARRDDVDFEYVGKISLPEAVRMGRERVSTPFFAFLDDDDYFLPGALRVRWERMQMADRPDAVVSTGIRMDGERVLPSGASIAEAKAGKEAALRALLANAWLTSAGGLFRTATVGADLFSGAPSMHEWTYFGCRLILEANLVFLDEPGYFLNDTPVSESKSLEYDLTAVDALDRLLALKLPRSIRPLVQRKRAAALHFASARFLDAGDPLRAWRYHLQSIVAPGGLKYLTYTRRLFRPLLTVASQD